ncbi:MAG: hypothetical protein P9M02_00855 [Candidatus Susulua stagnicola]|nr:hypothetical protein [Candidatus Susulua stagnicola]
MKLLKRFKNLFTPKTEKPKKKVNNKIKAKPKKKVLKKRTVKKKPEKKAKKKIAAKAKKKIVKKPAPKKVVKKISKPLKKVTEKEIGVITHYFGKISVGIIKLSSTLRIGEKIHIKGVHDDFSQTVKSMQINYKDVLIAGRGSEIGIKILKPAHENDKVYKI